MSAEALLTQRSRMRAQHPGCGGSLCRKLSDSIHHIYRTAPLSKTLVREVSHAHASSHSERQCSSHFTPLCPCFPPSCLTGLILFLKHTEPLATSLLHLLGFPRPGLLSCDSALSCLSSSCRVQLTCDLLTQALPEPLL